MALKLSAKNDTKADRINFENHIDAQVVFKDRAKSEDDRIAALEYLIDNQNISHILKLINLMFNENNVSDHIYINIAFDSFHNVEKTDEDYENFTKCLESENVYLRNIAIKYLQESDEEAAIFIDKLLNNKDKDIRIFAINILGDVKYDKSVDMLRYFIAQEDDINAMMTAVDYLGEIGSLEDIDLLETLKVAHKDNAYVVFGVDMAIDRIKG